MPTFPQTISRTVSSSIRRPCSFRPSRRPWARSTFLTITDPQRIQMMTENSVGADRIQKAAEFDQFGFTARVVPGVQNNAGKLHLPPPTSGPFYGYRPTEPLNVA